MRVEVHLAQRIRHSHGLVERSSRDWGAGPGSELILIGITSGAIIEACCAWDWQALGDHKRGRTMLVTVVSKT